jgi:hypothetical protein
MTRVTRVESSNFNNPTVLSTLHQPSGVAIVRNTTVVDKDQRRAMMKLQALLLRVLVVVLALLIRGSSAAEEKCEHGLTANDIALNTGLNLTGKVALVTGGRSGLVSTLVSSTPEEMLRILTAFCSLGLSSLLRKNHHPTGICHYRSLVTSWLQCSDCKSRRGKE